MQLIFAEQIMKVKKQHFQHLNSIKHSNSNPQSSSNNQLSGAYFPTRTKDVHAILHSIKGVTPSNPLQKGLTGLEVC